VDIKPYDVVIREEPPTVQKLYRFSNGLGASVIRGEFSYGGDEGLWELAVIKFTDEGGYVLVYPKEVCQDEDVVGWLTDEQVDEKLVQIANLRGDEKNGNPRLVGDGAAHYPPNED
jgi:hypothetical protein